MGKKTRTSDNRISTKHPYENFESLRAWAILDKALDDLVKNRDIEEKTRRELIVGFLCKRLRSELEPKESAKKPSRTTLC